VKGDNYRDGGVFLAVGFFERLRGLLFTEPNGRVIMLAPCGRVHTYGMRHDLDIAFLDREGRVLSAYRGVRPRRCLGERRAAVVLERFADDGRPWLEAGERLCLATGDGKEQEAGDSAACGGAAPARPARERREQNEDVPHLQCTLF